MKNTILLGTTLAASLLAANAHAFEFGPPIKTTVNVSKAGLANTAQKQVMLMNIKLTPTEQRYLFDYQPKKKALLRSENLPSATDLGMNDVPVLDQGKHGTCATFAVTAAVDALIGKGDYISQLCNLELGSTLENHGYLPSGWNGTLGAIVHDQMMRFGIVNKETQKNKSCAGVTEYPLMDYADEGKPMSLQEFKEKSENINELGNYFTIEHLNAFDRFNEQFNTYDQAEKVLQQTRKALSNGNRLTFGTFLVLSPYCNAGACATYKTSQDTWALTQEIELPPYFTGGHEMVITAFDDTAVATDKSGKKHVGILTLRNSWGDDVGDKGNFYMTYDYFKKFVMEVHEIAEFKM